MMISRKLLCAVYAAAGVACVAGTWGNNIAYFDSGILEANVRFWQETFANPASRSITVDILALGFAAIAWMFLEARRLAMRGVWLYVLFGVFVAMGAAFPFFLIHRERVLAAREGTAGMGTLSGAELFALAMLGGAFLVYTVTALKA
jgi:hypothetical protein